MQHKFNEQEGPGVFCPLYCTVIEMLIPRDLFKRGHNDLGCNLRSPFCLTLLKFPLCLTYMSRA